MFQSSSVVNSRRPPPPPGSSHLRWCCVSLGDRSSRSWNLKSLEPFEFLAVVTRDEVPWYKNSLQWEDHRHSHSSKRESWTEIGSECQEGTADSAGTRIRLVAVVDERRDGFSNLAVEPTGESAGRRGLTYLPYS